MSVSGLNTPVVSDPATLFQQPAAVAQGAGANGSPVYGGNYLPVGTTAVNGEFGPSPGLSSGASVNRWKAFLLTQTTAGITVTPPNLTGLAATGYVFEFFTNDVNTSTQSFTMLGAVVQVGNTAVLLWTPGAAGGWTLAFVASQNPGGSYWPFASAISPAAPALLEVSNGQPIMMQTASGGIGIGAGIAPVLASNELSLRAAGSLAETSGTSVTRIAGSSVADNAGTTAAYVAATGITVETATGNAVVSATNSNASVLAGGVGSVFLTGQVNASLTATTGAASMSAATTVQLTAGTTWTGSSGSGQPMILQPGTAVAVGATTPNASATVDLQSTSLGLGLPALSATTIAGLANPVQRLICYDSTNNRGAVQVGSPASPVYSTAGGGPVTRATNSSGQAIPAGSATTETGWTSVENRGAAFVPSTGIWTAPYSGNVQVEYTVSFVSGITLLGGAYSASLVQAGSVSGSQQAGTLTAQVAAIANTFAPHTSGLLPVVVGDTLTTTVLQNSSGTLALGTNAASENVSFAYGP
jgi:hypothetical protein